MDTGIGKKVACRRMKTTLPKYLIMNQKSRQPFFILGLFFPSFFVKLTLIMGVLLA